MNKLKELKAVITLKSNPNAENFKEAIEIYYNNNKENSKAEYAKFLFNKLLNDPCFSKYLPREDDIEGKSVIPFWYDQNKCKIYEPGVFLMEELKINGNNNSTEYKYNLKKELSDREFEL